MLTPVERSKLWPILFWGPATLQLVEDGKVRSRGGVTDPVGSPHAGIAIAELVVGLFTGFFTKNDPKDFVRPNIPIADRTDLAKALAGGQELEAYFGHASCRICNAQLGCKDLHGWGFMWPEKADHYVLEHQVWTPGCSRLLAAVRST